MIKNIILHRKNGHPSWAFKYNNDFDGYIYHTSRGKTYMLFFGDPYNTIKPFWIGLFNDDKWLSVEHEIHADYIDFVGSRLIFK